MHTRQHYDYGCRAFFDGLELPQPDINLGVGLGSHAAQTGALECAGRSEPERIALAVRYDSAAKECVDPLGLRSEPMAPTGRD